VVEGTKLVSHSKRRIHRHVVSIYHDAEKSLYNIGYTKRKAKEIIWPICLSFVSSSVWRILLLWQVKLFKTKAPASLLLTDNLGSRQTFA
jgi:hypothetical protein